MQSFRSHIVGKAPHQGPCPSLTSRELRCGRSCGLSRLGAVSENGNGKVHSKQLKFFYFDPNNPEEVREMHVKHRDTHSYHHSSSNGSGYNGNGYAGNGVHHNHNGHAQSNGHSSSQLMHMKESSSSKDLAQLQRLTAQLEEARSVMAKLQQYEVLYKESRMRSKQMQVEVSTLQQLLADKDAELARQYKRMELEASERSGLRTQFNSTVDEVKALRNELEEARQAMLELRGVIPANVTLRRGLAPRTSSGLLDESGNISGGIGSSGSASPDVLSSLQGLARQLAEGMEHEVGSLFGGASGVGKRDA